MFWTPVRRLQTWISLFFLGCLSTVALLSGSAPSSSADRNVDFARDIRPILEANCNQCHGVDQSMNGLRLDTREAALKGGQSGPAIRPGDGSSSLLYRKIVGDAPGSPMPLTGTLPPDQVEMIRTWLDQGAPWTGAIDGTGAGGKKHWAYVKPVRPGAPKVKNRAWVRNTIDRFVLARLEREGLEPSPEASRETLIRRLTLDLIGLPPTPGEVDAFVEDQRPLAYERLVDRLLSSPRYGERWARPWLDLARYADTNGYIHDRRRNMWLYRDWVIKAINTDMPFDQFTIEQVAGDLLPDATPEQKIATGFHRNTMINTEGGTTRRSTGSPRFWTASRPPEPSGSGAPSPVPSATITSTIPLRRRSTSRFSPSSTTRWRRTTRRRRSGLTAPASPCLPPTICRRTAPISNGRSWS